MEEQDFAFPFPPYNIQKDFMKSLYKCLDEGNLGIFESPTGTGKTMSIICGALKWLHDYEKKNETDVKNRIKELDEQLKAIERESTGDWIDDHSKQMIVNQERRIIQDKLEAIESRVKRKESMKKLVARKLEFKSKRKVFPSKKKNFNGSTSEKILEGDENNETGGEGDHDLLLEDLVVKSDESDGDEECDNKMRYIQFFLCSRTHSQLSQFIGEFKKSPYAEGVSLVPIGSRQNYCVNEAVKKLGNIDLINEKCLELQRSKKTTSKKEKDLKRSKTTNSCCPYNPGDQNLLIAEIITTIHDIEEIVETAKEIDTCAYYACRKSLQNGQVIVLPYNSILHKNTRLSSGINLKDNVIIIDEAHNLLEAIERMHCTSITGRNILHCFSQLSQYQKKFENLFSAKNVLYLNQLSFCLKKLIKMLGGTTRCLETDTMEKDQAPKVYTLQNFETTAEIDSVNMFELIKFIQTSKLVHKLQSYLDKHSEDLRIHPIPASSRNKREGVAAFLTLLKNGESLGEICEKTSKVNDNATDENILKSPLIKIVGFLESLKSACADGRIFVIPGRTLGQGVIKFLLMNPAAHFHDIVKEARSIILAGGTMEPISEFRDQLFIKAGAPLERIMTFSCDHVVPKENILTRILTKGPNNIPFEFNYQNRDNQSLLNEVGRTLINLTNIVPGGIVVFLPSYKYEETLYKHLDSMGIIKKITQKKQVFREPKSSSVVTSILDNFAESIKRPKGSQNGSLLFSVVGGKLSEGLNFSDDLGRCIIVVGMPYPNIKSPELQEKMKYLNENIRAGAGSEYYENSCMKAVNQCIGRAVRHINDYATVILIDRRYANKCKALPGWIQKTLKTNGEFSMTIGDVARFFAAKRKNSN
ncbi:ATP-dependent DNA helicase DDX11 [Diachasma alloeum]|uniref:ATP-dependent DNA helicase DDX11 n=1 Tax=Diachasma alloeum TaxID=454923 RepID=UPI000738153B|nr:ATP-dependent DNA helicase DDX11 [Diachasma alloeum]